MRYVPVLCLIAVAVIATCVFLIWRDKEKPASYEEKSEHEENPQDLNVVKMVGSLSKEISKSTKLLLAIKPYLSQGRQNMIGNILKLSSLSSVLNLLG